MTDARTELDIAVIGGGICGLTTAIALERRGFSPTVYEAASAYRPVGAGILLQTNALLVFDRLGIASEVRTAGTALDDVRILGADGRLLQGFDLETVERRKFGYGHVAIHRAALQRTLLDELDAEVQTGKACVAVQTTDPPTALFDDGSRIDPDLIVGTDGIDSTVREAVAPGSEPRSVDTTVYRAIVDCELPSRHQRQGVEVWGRGTYTGGAPVSDDRFYWFATAPKEGANWASDGGEFTSAFRDFPEPLPRVVESVEPESVITAELEDVPALDRWSRDAVVLAGDAVHGMLPFAGQGAAQGIEDAVSLAAALDEHDDHRAAVEAYERTRKRRADRIRAEAHWLGRLSAAESGPLCRLRNRAMSLLPDRLFHRLRRRRMAATPLPD